MAEPFHCDFSKRLFMGHLGNHLLNAADFHADHRGFGMTQLNPEHKTWVLSRLAIEMETMPAEYAKFSVETWIEGVMKYFTNRNFRILEVNGGEIAKYINADKECPIDGLSRVKMGSGARLAATIDTHYSDVDVNGHINSIKYIEHVLDLFGTDWYSEHCIRRFDIAYVAESHYGDKLNFYMEEAGEGCFCVRITKKTPADDGETEVCRSKVTFVKKQ